MQFPLFPFPVNNTSQQKQLTKMFCKIVAPELWSKTMKNNCGEPHFLPSEVVNYRPATLLMLNSSKGVFFKVFECKY